MSYMTQKGLENSKYNRKVRKVELPRALKTNMTWNPKVSDSTEVQYVPQLISHTHTRTHTHTDVFKTVTFTKCVAKSVKMP